MKRGLACLLLVACVSCVTDDDYWTFRVTRTVWSEEALTEERTPSSGLSSWKGDSDEELLALGVLLIGLPLAIDIVLLPITLTHDLLYVH